MRESEESLQPLGSRATDRVRIGLSFSHDFVSELAITMSSSSLIPQKRELNDSNDADSSSPKRPKENTGSSITTKPIEEILKFYQMFLNFHRLEKDKFIELTKLKERLSRENGLYNDLSQAMIDTDFTTVRNMRESALR